MRVRFYDSVSEFKEYNSDGEPILLKEVYFVDLFQPLSHLQSVTPAVFKSKLPSLSQYT